MTNEAKTTRIDKSYQVYALVDPRDNAIHYISITAQYAEIRLYNHISLSKYDNNGGKKEWIAGLQQKGLIPILKVLETIEASQDSRAKYRNREQYWINEMLRLGYSLLNVAGNTQYHTPKINRGGESNKTAASTSSVTGAVAPNTATLNIVTSKKQLAAVAKNGSL